MAKAKKPIYPPRYVVYCVVKNYMDDEKLKRFNLGLGSSKFQNDRDFLRFVLKHIDIELLRTSPVLWQDIWVYNYLTYDFKKQNFDKKGLLQKYSNEILAWIYQ